jgi:hypothetical protein
MTRIRLILLSVGAILAVSAVASASASAACSAESGNEAVYCVEESTGVFNDGPFEAKIASKNVPGTVFILNVTGGPSLQCKKLEDKADIIQPDSAPGENSDVELKFTECSVIGFANCVVQDKPNHIPGTIIVGPEIDSHLALIGGSIYDVFEPSEGTTFVELQILNKEGKLCTVKQENGISITGTECGLAEQTLKVASVLKFSKAIKEACKTELHLGLKTAFLEGESEEELTAPAALKGKPWGVSTS